MRVHELAKELNLSSKDMLERLHALGIEAKTHSSSIDAPAVERARAACKTASAPAPVAAPAPAAAPAAPAVKPPPAKAAPAPVPEKPVPPPPPKAQPAAPIAKVDLPAPARPAAPARPPAAPAAPVRPQTPPPVSRPPVPPPIRASAPSAYPRASGPVRPSAPPPKPAAPAPAPAAAPAPAPATPPPVSAHVPKTITVRGAVIVKDLADLLGMRANQLIAELMAMNILASINERLDLKVAQKIAERHGVTVEHEKKISDHRPPPPKKAGEETDEIVDRPEDLMSRPPVVTILGHVDHGKTSLLDKIRNASVAKGESGGITQHIGAYTLDLDGRKITFLDTPGHEAFTAMRARGANLTDIAVIVIAADDGIMPQTVEAIKHAQAAEVPIMVAINKVDLPAANPDRVKQQLAGMNLTPEDWGGTVICCPVSAITGKGVNEFLEMILLQAEMLELKANPKRKALGYVIEAQLEPGMGPTVNLLVTNGTLSVGDILLCGPHWGRVRALINDHGIKVKSAGPSTPVKCLGLSGVPQAGAEFRVCATDRMARELAEDRMTRQKTEQVLQPKRASLDSFFQQLKDNERIELKILLKADVQGSLEAIEHALRDIKSQKVLLNIIYSGVGNITTNDVLLASASTGIVLGFHVAVEPGTNQLAKREGVEIRLHSIIYELIDQVRDAMAGLLAPMIREKIMGHAEVKQVFTISKGGKVAGCGVKDGKITPRLNARVKRAGDVVFQGSIASLRRFQNDVSEVSEGQECGIRLDSFGDLQAGDIIEFFDVEKIAQQL